MTTPGELYFERIIGRRAIMAFVRPMYGITTWRGALKHFQRNQFPLRYTTSGKPMFLKCELFGFEAEMQKFLWSMNHPSSP